jgi:hypothetical protein
MYDNQDYPRLANLAPVENNVSTQSLSVSPNPAIERNANIANVLGAAFRFF